MDIAAKLTGMCEPLLAGAGYELVLVEVVGLPRRRTVRFFIDREGGVTVDDCSRASRLLEPVIDAAEVFQGVWVLEVSSPGLERPLFKPGDYERFAGRKAKIKLKEAHEDRKTITGILRGVAGGDKARVEVDGGEVLEVPLTLVARANLVFEWK